MLMDTLGASYISSVVYECTRTMEDRIRMQHEDERTRLMNRITMLEKQHEKDLRTQVVLKGKFVQLSELYSKACENENVDSNPLTVLSGRYIEEKETTKKSDRKMMWPSNLSFNSTSKLKAIAGKQGTELDTNTLEKTKMNSSSSFALPFHKSVSLLTSKAPGSLGALARSSTIGRNPSPITAHVKKKTKFIDVVRKKSDRDELPGFACEECSKYFDCLEQQGIISPGSKADMLQRCSRHKSRDTPPSTPDGFWDMSIKTPDSWNEK